jgi:hypothetical protein
LKKAVDIAKEQFSILINFLRKYPLKDVKSHSPCIEQYAHKFRLQNRQNGFTYPCGAKLKFQEDRLAKNPRNGQVYIETSCEVGSLRTSLIAFM